MHSRRGFEIAVTILAFLTSLPVLAAAGEGAMTVPAADALRRYGLSRRMAGLLATLAAASPVVVNQLFTFYVDGLLASSLLAVSGLAAAWWETRERTLLALAGGALLHACNLKFTGVLY